MPIDVVVSVLSLCSSRNRPYAIVLDLVTDRSLVGAREFGYCNGYVRPANNSLKTVAHNITVARNMYIMNLGVYDIEITHNTVGGSLTAFATEAHNKYLNCLSICW